MPGGVVLGMLSEIESVQDQLVGREEALAELAHGLETAAGAVVVGPAGIGKTALIRAAAANPAFHPVTIRGSRISGKTPFGALAWVISEMSEGIASRPEQLLQELGSLLKQRAGGKRLLLLLDNVEYLDDWTAMAVSQLIRRSGASVLATAEHFSESAPDMLALWTEGLLHRVDLGPLPLEQTRELMQKLLGGPVSTMAAQSMQRHSGGNPQIVTLHTRGQADEGSLARQDGVWVLAKPLVFSGQVSEVITARLKRLPPDERSLVQLLALSSDLPLTAVLKLFPAETVDSLEEAGVVEVSDQGVRLASRGTAAAIAAAIAPGRSRELWEEVSALVDPTALSPSAVIRFARWTLACQGTLDPETARRAARLSSASDDPESALRFIRAVPGNQRTPAMLLAEVEALKESGDHHAALGALGRLPSSPPPGDPETWVALMLQKAALLRLLPGHDSPAEVLDTIAAEIRGLPANEAPHTWEARVLLMRSTLAIDGGHPGEVPEGLGALAADRSLDPPLRLQAIALQAQFLALSGNAAEVLTLLQSFKDGFQGTLGANTLDSVHLRMYQALVAAGEHLQAEQLVTELVDGANRRAFRGSAGDVATGLVHALGGRLDSALAALTSAAGQIQLQDPFDVLPLVQALSAHVLAVRGDLGEAGRAVASVPDYRYRPQELVRLLTRALETETRLAGDPEKLCGELRSMALRCLETGMVPVALHCLAAATRHGDPAAARELAAAAAAATGRWARALHCFGAGHEQASPALLLEAAVGAVLLGNEQLCNSAAQAALQLLRGRTDSGSRALARNALKLEHDSFRKLREANGIQARMAALTPFEADLARRAAGTATRREISEDLHLSPRTIDWHLGKIFDKLHVSGRSELGEVLR